MSNPLYQFLSLDTNSPMCSDNIVFLLGAGASIDAGIPTLNKMMQLYEEKKLRVDRKDGKKVNEKLYDYFKRRSASRQYSLNSSANIEDMLAVMEDFIQMQEGKKPMYNLVGNWDKELMAIIGYNFNDIVVLRDDLKKHVIEQLTEEWKGDKGKQLDYFHFLFYLQAQIGGVMKIFTLNHDRSIEESYRRYYASHFNPGGGEPKEATLLETGFGDKIIRNNEYEYRPDMFFDPGNFDVEKKAIKLYKLHGSIDWQTENEDRIRLVKKPAVSEVIFGISQKYKSEEPYSLLYPEFKKALAGTGTQARMLVIVGYSFNDPHINDAIRAAMHSNSKLKILICEPGLCETQYFGLPQTSNDPGNAACEFIKNITKSEDYETYINMSVMLHSVYYSRNFDEDALFLSACLNTGDMILKTKARDKHQGGKFGKRILQNILTQNTEIAMLEKYFQQPHAGISKQERNHYVYCNMPGLSISYKEVLNCIDETKVKVYGIQKKYDIDLRGSKGQAGDAVAAENEIKAALELIDDLRMVEKFIKEFIPVHLSMMYGLIEQYNMTGISLNEKINLEISIFEMYLKYNYLIDAIEIKLAKVNKNKGSEEHLEAIYEILGKDYCLAFLKLINDHELGPKLNNINSFLKEVKNSFLVNGLDKELKQHELVKNITGDTGIEFQDVFLAWNDVEFGEAKFSDASTRKDPERVLYKPEGRDKKIALQVMFYSKGLAKSMVHRFTHAERLLLDLKSMITIVCSGDNYGKDLKTCYEKLEKLVHYADSHTGNGPDASIHPLLKLIEKDFRKDTIGSRVIELEMNNKVPTNLNWYVNRFFRIQSELTDSLFMVKFDLPERGIHFGKNLAVCGRILKSSNYAGQQGAGQEAADNWKALLSEIEKHGMQALYNSGSWNTIRESFKYNGNPGNYLNRIHVCHFPAKIFFTKNLRAYTLFRSYFSVFHAEEHIRSFCDVNRMILSRK